MGAVAVGFVEFGGSRAGGIDGVADFFEIADEFFGAGAYEELGVAEVVAETGIDAVDAVADVRVGVREVAADLDFACVVSGEESTDEVPVGGSGGGSALMAGGVAVDLDLENSVGATDRFEVGFDVLDEDSASFLGSAAVGANSDFGEDIDVVVNSLHDEHAHGIDVEIDRPDERGGEFEVGVADVGFAVEREIGAVLPDGGELGFEFLAVGIGVGGAADGFQFGFVNDAALFGGELVGSPLVGIGLGEFEVVVEMVAAFWSAEEEGAAFAVGESGVEALRPDVGFEIGSFVEDDEIETVAAQVVRVEAAMDNDG